VFINDASWELEAIADRVDCTEGLCLPEGCTASPAARDFLAACLHRDPESRPSAKELLQHPWLLGASSLAELAAGRAAAGGGAALLARAGGSRPRLVVRVASSPSMFDDEHCSEASSSSSSGGGGSGGASSSGGDASSSGCGSGDECAGSAPAARAASAAVGGRARVQLRPRATRQSSLDALTICEIKLAASSSTASLTSLALAAVSN
jgi:serine/threonine protein kinase